MPSSTDAGREGPRSSLVTSSPFSPQPQTNSTKNSSAITSPKGSLPPAALVLSPCLSSLTERPCQAGSGETACL